MPISSDTQKRTKSLLQSKPEQIIDLADKWNRKHTVKGSQAELNTKARIFEPASNVERQAEEGCMKKIKIERSLKLRQEDIRSRTFNILSNKSENEDNWLGCYGQQKEQYFSQVMPKMSTIHDEKKQITNKLTNDESINISKRLSMDYKPKMNVTWQSSIRYKHTPKDNELW